MSVLWSLQGVLGGLGSGRSHPALTAHSVSNYCTYHNIIIVIIVLRIIVNMT